MYKIIIASTLLLMTIITIAAIRKEPEPTKSSIRFRKFDPIILNDTAAQLMIQIYNGERVQELDLLCTLAPDSIHFTGVYLPNDRNVIINYRGSIPLNK